MATRIMDHAIWIFVFFVSLFDVMPHTKLSAQGNSHAFIQANSDVRYLVDGIPVPVHKELVGASGVRVPSLEESSMYNSKLHLKFDPPLLDFKQRHLGIPHHEKVTLFNVNNNKTIHMSSISGNTVHFHSSFFEDKVIPPLGNTTFNVVFLGREEGEIESNLFIHTSEGSFKYKVKGASISSPYRLRPLVGIRVPLNATYAPLINIHNPHTTPMQIVEVYSSGGEFHLELPSGELEGPKHLWEIPPFQTKPIIRVRFVARAEKNHTAYVRIKVNKSDEVLVVPLEVEVLSQPGLYSQDDVIDFGIGGSNDRPRKVKLALYNSLKKVIRIQNVVVAPFSKAVKVDYQPLKIPSDANGPTQVATLTFDWQAAFETNQLSGKVIIKSKQNQHKLVIPYVAQVLEGGLEYNASVTQYCSEFGSHIGVRNFSVKNSFKVNVAITDVSLSKEAEEYFSIENFKQKIIKPQESVILFQLSVKKGNLLPDFKLKSSLLVYSNISTVWVPILCYSGRLSKVIISEINETELNFGTVGSASQREALFALFNSNPVPISLMAWGSNFSGASIELLGVAEGNRSVVERRQNFSNLNMSSVLEPNSCAVFKVMLTVPDMEGELQGSVYVKTQFENIKMPVKMRVAHGRLEVLPDPLILDNCFPGKICRETLQIRSLFSRAMRVTSITSVPHDPRMNYWISNTSAEIIPLATSTIGEITFDPAVSCGNNCYLGVDTNSTAGNQWLQLLELPSHVHDIDLSLLTARYTSYIHMASDQGFPVWQNISLQLHTTEVRRHAFSAKVMMTWPLLTLNVALSPGNTSLLTFPLTQIGNTTYQDLVVHNPSSRPLTIQLVMDWAYPVAERLLHDLPDGLTRCHECHNSPTREFSLEEGSLVGSYLHSLLGVLPHVNSLGLVLQPGEVATTRLGFSPLKTGLSSAVLLIRNNLTILEVVRLSGRAAHAQFKFGNRKPGSDAPLMFELAEKHLKDCEREKNRKFPVPNLTVKRSFTARNTGDLSIYVRGFSINGLPCEGYGFRVLNCAPFQLLPNGTRKIDIAFTPDFTLARIQRSLSIETSLGISVNYSLITTLPPYFLASCSSVLGRPSWEPVLYYCAISFMMFILFCVLAAAFLESDRILKCAFVAVDKDKALRAASDIKPFPTLQKNSDNKVGCGKSENISESNVSNSVSHHNEKRHKDSNNTSIHSNNFCSKNCWNNFDEKHIEGDHKEKTGTLKFDETEAYSGNSTPLLSVKNKKKLSKKNSNNSEPASQSEYIPDAPATKKGWGSFLTRSNLPHQSKSKVNVTENKSTKSSQDLETSIKKPLLENPKEEKRSNQSHKKCVRTISEPIICSEEETSSTTTESSNNDDIEKERENLNSSRESKVSLKKEMVKEVYYKDNYEGDCDDDEYEHEESKKKELNNHWKPNTKTTSNKVLSEAPVKVTNIEVLKPTSLELPYKLKTTKPVSRERKEKNVLKKRASEKHGNGKASSCVSGSTSSSSSSNGANSTIRVSPPLRTTGTCWGEHRASFSDVVARSDSTLYSNIVAPQKRQQPSSPTSLPTVFNSENNSRIKSSDHIPASSTSSGLGPIGSKKPSSSSWDLTEPQQPLPTYLHPSPEPASLFVDALAEPSHVEVEEEKNNANPYGGDAMWEQGSSIVPLLEEDPRKIANEYGRQDLFRDNWPGVDSLWEPLYTPAVDNSQLFSSPMRNEMRGSGTVWGSLIGSVWSSSTWSNAPGPVAPPINSVQNSMMPSSSSHSNPNISSASSSNHDNAIAPVENITDVDQGLGFDPFRSLNTIWFPASSDTWNPAGNNK